MERSNRRNAYIAAVIFSILVGFSFLGLKTCIVYADTLAILTHRYNWALIGIILFLGADRLRGNRLKLRNKPKRNLILTASFYVMFMIIQTIGLRFATSVEGAIIYAMTPILAKIIAEIFLGEKSGLMQNIFVVMSVAGLIIMIAQGAEKIEINVWASVILFISSLSMACSNVFMRYVRNVYRPVEISLTIVIIGVVSFNAAYIGRGIYQGTLSEYFAPCHYMEFNIAVCYLGIACILFSAQLMAYVLRYLEAVKGTIFGNLSTAISIIAGVVILNEPLELYHIICTILIIAGVLGISLWPDGNKKGNDILK